MAPQDLKEVQDIIETGIFNGSYQRQIGAGWAIAIFQVVFAALNEKGGV
jgi:hypothetical protein